MAVHVMQSQHKLTHEMFEFVLRNQFCFNVFKQVSMFSLLQDQVQVLSSFKTRKQRDQMLVRRNRYQDLHTRKHEDDL